MATSQDLVQDALSSELAERIIKDAAMKNQAMKTDSVHLVTSIALDSSDGRQRLVPQTSDRLFSSYTTDERRAIYDYVVSKTGAAETINLEDFKLPFEVQKSSGPKTQLELLAEERDAKRRRISYRSKKVSTNRKSHTEVIREVIQNQMHSYGLWLRNELGLEEKEEEGSDTNIPIKVEGVSDRGTRHQTSQTKNMSVVGSAESDRDAEPNINEDATKKYNRQKDYHIHDNRGSRDADRRSRKYFRGDHQRDRSNRDGTKDREHHRSRERGRDGDRSRGYDRNTRDYGSRSDDGDRDRNKSRYHRERKNPTSRDRLRSHHIDSHRNRTLKGSGNGTGSEDDDNRIEKRKKYHTDNVGNEVDVSIDIKKEKEDVVINDHGPPLTEADFEDNNISTSNHNDRVGKVHHQDDANSIGRTDSAQRQSTVEVPVSSASSLTDAYKLLEYLATTNFNTTKHLKRKKEKKHKHKKNKRSKKSSRASSTEADDQSSDFSC